MVMRDRAAKTEVAAGAGAEGGRRPTVVPAPAATAPELSDRPRRRTFTVQEKLRVLAETDAAAGVGGIGAILRREGLYSSTLGEWRRQRDSGALGALTPAKRGPKPALANPLAAELAQVKRENARLARRLEHAEAIIGIQKKVAALLGIPLATPDSDDES
jgi:transposase